MPGHSYQGNGARGHSTKASEKADRPQKIGDGGASGRSRRRATAALPRKVVAPRAADPCPLPRTVTPPDNPRCAPPPSCRGYRFLLHGEGSRERLRQMWRIASSPEVPRGPPSFRDLLAARPPFSRWTATAKRANKQAAALAGQPGSVFWACVRTPNTAAKKTRRTEVVTKLSDT